MASFPFRDINVHASSSHYAFSSPSSPSAPTLVIERPTGDLRLANEKILGTRRVSAIAGILGIINLRLDRYIIVVNKAHPVGRIKGNMIYKVLTTEWLPLRERPLRDFDEDRYIAILKDLMKNSPLYFSYTFDVTTRFQKQSELTENLALWQRADDRFFWNRHIQSDLIDFRMGKGSRFGHGREQAAVDSFILPVMFGMLEIRNTSVKGTPFTYILITRRSRFRAGTRYFSRGVDEHGNVSNFNETEQVIILNDDASKGPVSYAGDAGMQYDKLKAAVGKEAQVLSYVQTRGSVPVYWAEVNNIQYKPVLQIRGVDSAVPAAQRHFDQQIKTYGDNYLVNLVNQEGREKRVKEAYEHMVRTLVNSPAQGASQEFRVIEPTGRSHFDRLHYVYFDFHNETKGLQWHRAKILLQQLEEPVLKHGYFRSVDMPGGSGGTVEVRNMQTGAVRTNCMDCLDRTNVIQSMLGRFILTKMLRDLGILNAGESVEDDLNFEHLFRNIWADNADIVSKSYSGTGALKTDFTRTGERTKKGMLMDASNSTTRYIKNNFLDGPRQDAFDVFLGAYRPRASHLGKGSVFADSRPLAVQSVPYILIACLILVLVGSLTRRDDNAAVWPLRVVMIFCFVGAIICLHFMVSHGMLYVNWPKLNTPPWAAEGFQDSMSHARASPLLGTFVKSHERGRSEARVGYMEEGKKRIE